jgi:hypothetical protein
LFHQEFNGLSAATANVLYNTSRLIAIKALTTPIEDQASLLRNIQSLPTSLEGVSRILQTDSDSNPSDLEYIVCSKCFALYDHITMEPIRKAYRRRIPLSLSKPLPPVDHNAPSDKELEDGKDSDEEIEDEFSREEKSEDEEVWSEAHHYHCRAAVDGFCTSQSTPTSRPCGNVLLKTLPKFFDNYERPINPAPNPLLKAPPIKTFSVPSLKSFLQNILEQPQTREYMREFVENQPRQEGSTGDIYFSPYVQGLLDSSGKPFLDSQNFKNNELRLCLGLYIDWFGPRGNKLGAAHYSTGVIYLIILNLPPHLRYKKQYLFPIFIPGPYEPTTEGLNHLLGPLVDQLLPLWEEGCSIRGKTSDASNFAILRVMVMLAIIIADNPATSKCGGFASHSHRYFCHHCRLARSLINDFDIDKWPRLSHEQHLAIIEEWRDATSVQERNEIFEDWGLRWTELARLLYLDLTKCFVIDPMHAVLLGVAQNHVRQIFDINKRSDFQSASKEKALDQEVLIFPRERYYSHKILSHRFLSLKSLDLLLGLHLDTLVWLCAQRSISSTTSRPTKMDLVLSLAQWVSNLLRLSLASQKFQVEQTRLPDEVSPIDCNLIEKILQNDSLNREQKDLALSALPEEQLYRSCEDQGFETSNLTYRLYFPTKGGMINLLLSNQVNYLHCNPAYLLICLKPPLRQQPVIPIWTAKRNIIIDAKNGNQAKSSHNKVCVSL